jgi:hypothetical protein
MNPEDLPPVEFLVKARQHLPPPGPGLEPSHIRVDAGPRLGRFDLVFVVRQYSSGRWVWEIDSSKSVDPPRY